jgi:hypothetical protein
MIWNSQRARLCSHRGGVEKTLRRTFPVDLRLPGGRYHVNALHRYAPNARLRGVAR